MKLKDTIIIGLALACTASVSHGYPSKATKEERRDLDQLASTIEGAMLYTHRGRVKKITIGDWKTEDVGSGDYARWGPLGERIAVQDDDSLYIMNADGSGRERILSDEVDGGDGCQIEFHPNGREIIYGTRRKGARIIDIASRTTRDLKLPFNTEFNISADGKHLVMRRGDCYLVELPGTKYRKYAGGCSPCVSPDGTRMTSNKGGHRTMDIQQWNGKRLFQINAKKMGPDHKWDNMHWSNHNDYIAMQGDGRNDEAYAFSVSKNEGVRLSWSGRTTYPDLFVVKDRQSGNRPMEMTIAWKEAQGKQPQTAKTKKRGGREEEILALTGSPTRVVWTQARDGSHYGDNAYLVGMCTEDGKGEHRLLSEPGNFAKPVLSPDGRQVIYSDRKSNTFYALHWDGSDHRELGKGYASDVWRDPSDGHLWVYYRGGDGRTKGGVMRLRLDDPETREKVWDKTPTGHKVVPWFRLSADGTHAATAFPYNSCGVADLRSGKWEKYGNGCWASLAPDNSYRYFNFLGSHREIGFHEAGKREYRKIFVAGGPGVGKNKVYFPRWSHDARFLTVTGPKFTEKQEILLGKFDRDYTRVDDWVQISRNDKMDLFGDAWTKRGWEAKLGTKAPSIVEKPPVPRRDLAKFKTWPGDQRELVFLWENHHATNQTAAGRLCRIRARGRAFFGRHYEMILTGGHAMAEEIEQPLAKACQANDAITLEATLTAYGSEGEGKILSSEGNVALMQKGDQLRLQLRTSKGEQQLDLGRVDLGRAQHVLVSYRSGNLAAYFNGKEVKATSELSGDLDEWNPQPLVFGDGQWDGTLEGINVYARAIDAEEARHKYQLYADRLQKRKPVETLHVEGKLVEMTETPTVDSLQEYARGMVVHAYEVAKVIDGSESAPKIQVAHWVILDRQILPEMSERKLGESYDLHLEPLASHPQLESERSFNDCEDFDIPIYYATRALPKIKTPEIHLRINCAGGAIADWESDEDFVDKQQEGKAFTFKKRADTSSVQDPAPGAVYETVRHREHRYQFDVPNGDYLVRFHFIDDFDDKGTIRKMDFLIEDQRVLKQFNIVSAAGGTGKAVVREFPVNVSDGNGLQIRGEDPNGGDVFAAGIEILSR